MWGSFLDKAKNLADNLDKQITESVGIDENGNETTNAAGGGGIGTPLRASSFADILTGGSGEKAAATSNGGCAAGAWDDDFDDGFDDDEPAVAAPPAPVAAPQKAPLVAKLPPSPPAASPRVESNETMESIKLDNDNTTQPETTPPTQLAKESTPEVSQMNGSTQQDTPDGDDAAEGEWDNDIDDIDLDDAEAEDPKPEAPWQEKDMFSEPEPTPVVQTKPEPEPEPVVQPEPEPEPEPIVQPESQPELEPQPESAPVQEPVPEPSPPPAAPQANEEVVPAPEERSVPAATIPETAVAIDQSELKELREQLALREQQLAGKSEQLTQLQTLWEQQEGELRQKIQDTKDEAKKRIMRAKERCEAAEQKLQQQAAATSESGAQQDEIINALRAEGEKLARKQADMERSVRVAKGESRELSQKLESETAAKTQALHKIEQLEKDLAETRQSLSNARKGESQAGQLENELHEARSDAEKKATTILSLEQQIKELKAERKELQSTLKESQKTLAVEADRESKKMRREHNDVIADLEAKIRTTERDAGLREDSLRNEVAELRKRWEDAVRRADALSMDVQSSTAPLLRQLESMERQNRARAGAWTELETKLRSELEETIIENERISKERTEFKTKFNRLERLSKDRETELKECKITLEDQTAKVTNLEEQLAALEAEAEKREEEYTRVERLANEGVSRVRSEMTQTVVESEERYRGQIRGLENELRTQRDKCGQLEAQMGKFMDNPAVVVAAATAPATQAIRQEAKPKKLRQTEGQADILAGALGNMDDSDDEDSNSILAASNDTDDDVGPQNGLSSYAALDQLTSRLKAAQSELKTLRANLKESEKARSDLVKELAESGQAREKLPLFEAKVRELTEDNEEKAMEIQALRDDIAEVRDLYRSQLNQLLEEKAAVGNLVPPAPASNGTGPIE